MQRIPEPELMDEEEQARAYAAADFTEPHDHFIELFSGAFPDFEAPGFVLDLGCGPGDIAMRFARAYPGSTVHGIDGARAMLRCGKALLDEAPDLRGRVELLHCLLPAETLPRTAYDAVISNSLLHHLADPAVLWRTVKAASAPGAPVFIIDLLRPESTAEARRLTGLYMADEPEILRRDFYNSLLAAFALDEVRGQLEAAGLGCFRSRQVSDRHLVVWGRIETGSGEG